MGDGVKKGKKGKGKGKGAKDGKDASGGTGKSTELHAAAKDGDMVQIAVLLADASKATELINAIDQHNRTPLHLAAFFGKAGAVQKLLDAQADVTKEAMDGYLPLHFASQCGHLDVLRLLTRRVSDGKHGAVKNYVNRVVAKGKRSALHLALQKGHVECARFLVLKGASTASKNGSGQTALDLCQSDDLRKELGGAEVTAAEVEAGAEDVHESAPKRARMVAETDGEQGNVELQKPGRNAEVGAEDLQEPAPKRARTVVETGLQEPDTPPPAAALVMPGVLACGPFRLQSFECTVESGERSYPAGVGALANVHWGIATKANDRLIGGPVLCINSYATAQDSAGVRTLKLKASKSKYQFVEYTNFSDEGKLLPVSARCNHCGIMVLMETSDKYLVLAHRSAETNSLPNYLHAWPEGRLESADVMSVLKERLSDDVGFDWSSVQRLRVMALLGAGAESLEGRGHELVFLLNLSKSASDVEIAFQRRRAIALATAPVGTKAQKASAATLAALPASLVFVRIPRDVPSLKSTAEAKHDEDRPVEIKEEEMKEASEVTEKSVSDVSALSTLDFEKLLASSGEEKLTSACRTLMELVATIRTAPS